MTRLNILGATRVKAMEKILENKAEKEFMAMNQEQLRKEAQEQVNQEFGITEIQQEINALNLKINELHDLRQKLQNNGYHKRYAELVYGPRNAIKAKYQKLQHQLWLCETLEEAKAIVGEV